MATVPVARASAPRLATGRPGGARCCQEPPRRDSLVGLVAREGLEDVGRLPERSGTRNVDRISSDDGLDFRGWGRLGRQRPEPGSVSHIKTLDIAELDRWTCRRPGPRAWTRVRMWRVSQPLDDRLQPQRGRRADVHAKRFTLADQHDAEDLSRRVHGHVFEVHVLADLLGIPFDRIAVAGARGERDLVHVLAVLPDVDLPEL